MSLFYISCETFAGDSLSYFRLQVNYLLGTYYDYAFPDSVKNQFINDACGEIVIYVGDQVPCIQKLDTVIFSSGVIQYSANTDLFKIYAIKQLRSSKQAIDKLAIEDMGKRPSAGVEYPQTASQWSNKLYFDPKPTAIDTFLVFYNAYANKMTSNGDTTYLPKEFREFIPIYVKAKLFMRSGDEDLANVYLDRFYKGISAKIQILASQKFDIRIEQKIVPR